MVEETEPAKPAKVFGVYTHAKPDGTVFYVGKGTERRSRDFRMRSKPHKNVVAQCGADKIIVEFRPCESEATAFAEEVRLIARYRELGDWLVNITAGGEGPSGYRHSDEAREKIRAAHKKIFQEHPEKRETIAAFMKQRMLGKKLSAEHRAKIKAIVKSQLEANPVRFNEFIHNRRGKKHSSETRAKMSTSRKGRRNSAEAIAKNRAAQKGKPRWSLEQRQLMSINRKGRKLSAEHREKIRTAHIGKKRSPEAIQNMRFAQSGRTFSLESRQKQREARYRFLERQKADVLLAWLSIFRALIHI